MSTRSDRPARTRPASVTLSAALLAGTLAHALAAVPAHAASGDIYRTTQADGTVVFTDRPAPDATLVESRPLNIVGPGGATSPSGNGSSGATSGALDGGRADGYPELPATDTDVGGSAPRAGAAARSRPAPLAPWPGDSDVEPRADERDAMADVPIERVEIASPPPDATIVNPVGALLVEVGTAPGSLAASGLVAEAVVDGEVVASGASSIAVPPLDRGEHSLAVRLVDADGRVVVESAAQALYVRRTFVRPSDEDEP